MDLETVKKITLALIEEYSDGTNLTEDEDIKMRLNFLVNAPYQELARIKKISANHVFERDEVGEEDYYREYSLPIDLYQIRNIVIKDEKNKILNIEADYYIEENKIFINDRSQGKYVLNYYKYPKIITEDTEDSYILELDMDACNVLPYAIASDILKADISTDYSVFEAKYTQMLSRLDDRKDMSITIGNI